MEYQRSTSAITKTLFLLATVMFLSITVALGQLKTVQGIVKDSKTKEPIAYATVAVVGAPSSPGSAMSTQESGRFTLKFPMTYTKIRVSSIGYDYKDVFVTNDETQQIEILMDAQDNTLDEVVVRAKKRKYTNKENPAVALIRKVIENKSKNRLTGQQFAQYDQYEKISLGLSNLSEKFVNKKIFKNYQFLFELDDSAKTANKYLLPAFMEEKLSKVYYRKDPKKTKQYIVGEQRAQFDPKFIDNDGLSAYFNKLYESVDIYDNNITLVTNQFLSPIANSSPTFYKFFITDTIKTQQPWLVELSFFPRNKADMLFKGQLYITLDGNYAVQGANMTVADDINLNFVRDMNIELKFDQDESKRFYLSQSTLGIDFSLTDKGTGIRGNRTVNYKNYKTGVVQPDSIYSGPETVIAYNISDGKGTRKLFDAQRQIPLTKNELNIYHNIDTLQQIPSFKTFMDIAALVFSGYKQAGPVEIGPVNTFYSFNPVEGFRLRVGGRTTESFSKRFYAESYAAYGFKDEKWKYFLSGTYAFNNKSVYSFPQHYIRASFQRDTKIPGQALEFIQEDNFLLSFKRGDNENYIYNDVYRIDYRKEFENRLSIGLGFNATKQSPAGTLRYQIIDQDGQTRVFNEINSTELSVNVRYAPHEQFYQGKLYRTPIFNKYPIFNFNYTAGLKDVFKGEYSYHNFNVSAFKRFYLSQFGYADVDVAGTYIAGKGIPFPFLTIHRANQTYAYQLNSYNLMNFLEFVSDHHVSANVQYYMNGFLLNKIPVIKQLKLREVFSFKAVYGGLRDENNPDHSNQVFDFQKNANNEQSSYTFASEPYMEASVGLSNIFKILRVDYVRRLNYLNHPGAPKSGIRARVKFDF
ncbi:membrane protein [Sphingobacterium faecium NBRC 15299]|uniref:DUF5686 family protein n=1 Tax=Sphingobacterium faecium TaxID=34087 RepID=UPI000D3A7459|nr:DUF5686 family protein [Sphingobacterium faecium]PTX12114.1 carboxypeptidase-like protein [Sphingobacterium faecium]GEM63120.1 membrane protein [Sphingobacterium faecium NBRC 15299]